MGEFKYKTEQFADIKIMRYLVPGFEELKSNQRVLLYYLHEAAMAGRDILYDQNYKHNLEIRKLLEAVYTTYSGDKTSEIFLNFEEYLKRVWFSNGIHHHYSMDKFLPKFSRQELDDLLDNSNLSNLKENFQSLSFVHENLYPSIFDKDIDNKRVSLDSSIDIVEGSACNYYEGVTQKEAEEFYSKKVDVTDKEPISHGLNSKLIKKDGEIIEEVWKVGGMYSPAISKLVYWLEKAVEVGENEIQIEAFKKLIEYFQTGNLRSFDEYNKLWLKDTESIVDVIIGFIEVYGDPLGKKATYESVVSIKDVVATKRAKTISDNALWFEQNSSTDAIYKKDKIEGVSAKVINVVAEAGDCSPSTPIGINLPNADWMRSAYGSKSVTINNIMDAYDNVSKESGALKEFAYDEEEIRISKEYGHIASNLHVDLHEIIGHGSGRLKEGVSDPAETLKNYASTLEEARADLVALYFALHPKLIELNLMPSIDVGKCEYNGYIRSSLMTQLVRVELGKDLEESHMRNRQIIAKWAYEKGKDQNVIEKIIKDGNTFFRINDYDRLREIFGELLREVQRIKSEGDYDAGKALVENYGVKIDKDIHEEVIARWKKLNIAPYSGFINPLINSITKDGIVVDAEISYPEDFAKQMLYYSQNHSFL